MKVLVLNWLDRENPRAGGAEVHLHEVFGRLATRGWEITLVTSGWAGAAPLTELDGMETQRVGRRLSYPFEVFRHVRQRLSGRDFDVVVEDLNKAPLLSPLWAPAPTLLVVHHLLGSTAFGNALLPVASATWCLERLVPLVYRDVPCVTVSESTRRDLAIRGLSPDRIRVVNNGVDSASFVPGEEGDRDQNPTVLYLGRLVRYKRVDLVLSAIAQVRANGYPVRLVIAGSGAAERGLRRLASRLGLSGSAVSFVGHVSEEEKRDLFRRAWAHVLTSEKEGWGITNLEAAACGTPSIVSDSPGLRESVMDGETGFVVPHGDVSALADRIAQVVTNPGLRAAQGAAAREFALRYSWAAAADGFAEAMRWAVDSAEEAR